MHRLRSIILWTPILGAIFLWQALPWGEYPYNSDCLRVFLPAKNIVTLSEYPLQASDEILNIAFHGPLLSYMFAPFFLFTASIYTGYFVLFALNSFLCILVYRFGRDFWNQEVGVLAALFCCSYHVLSGVRWQLPSNHTFVPFFTLLFFTSLYNTRFRERARPIIPVFLFLSCLLQIHVIGFPAAILLVLFFPWRQIRPKHLLLGLIVFFLSFGPYYLYLWQDYAEIVESIVRFFSVRSESGGSGGGFYAVADLYRMLFSIENGNYLECLRLTASAKTFLEVSGILCLAGLALPFLATVIRGRPLATVIRGRPKEGMQKEMMLVAWFVFGALLLLFSPYYFNMHLYFIRPAAWILSALGLQGCALLVLGRKGARWCLWGASFFVFLLVVLMVVRAVLPIHGTGRRCRSLSMPSLAEYLEVFDWITRFGLDEEGIQRHVLMGQIEDSNLYVGLCSWFHGHCSPEPSGGIGTTSSPEPPYFIMLTKEEFPMSRADVAEVHTLGDSLLIRYDPLIDQMAWRHSEDEQGCWFCPELDDASWERVDPFPYPLAPEAWCRRYLRGTLRLREKRRVFLVLNPGMGNLKAEETYINGAPIRMPEAYAGGSENARLSLDVTDHLVPGENLIAFSFKKFVLGEEMGWDYSYWYIYDLSSTCELPSHCGRNEGVQ